MENTNEVTRKLRARLDEYLAACRVEPIPLPENTDELERSYVTGLLRQAEEADDEYYVEVYASYLEGSRVMPGRATAESVFLDPAWRAVESAIRADQDFAGHCPPVLVGEYPTGTFNAQSVREPEGYLVLLNAGTNILVWHAMVGVAMSSEEGDLPHGVGDFLSDLIVAYVLGLDVLAVPAPCVWGLESTLSSLLANGIRRFMIAHEYGHIIAGHLDAAPINRNRRDPAFIAKSKQEEFEADWFAARLTLGSEWPTFRELEVILAADAPDCSDSDLIIRAIEAKATLTAPLMFFTLDHLVSTARQAVETESRAPETHPPALDRLEKVIEPMLPHLGGSAVSYWTLARGLRELESMVRERAQQFLMDKPGSP